MPCADRRGNAQRQPDADLPKGSAQHHRQYRTAARAQRHAHADLARPLLHAIGSHAVETYCSQYKPERSKQRSQAGDHVLLGKIGVNHLRIGVHAVGYEVRINIRQRPVHLRPEARRISWRPNHDVIQIMRPHLALLRFWVIELSALRLREEIHGLHTGSEVHVGNDANDLVHSRVLLWNGTEVLPDGLLLAEEPSHKSLVDHGYRPRSSVVRVGDGPSHNDLAPQSLEESRRHAG